MARRPEAFSTTRDCAREAFPSGAVPAQRPSKAGAFPVSEGIWGLRSLERATPLIAEAGHGVRIPFAGACGRRIFQEAVQDAFRDGKAAIPLGKGLKAFRMGGKAGECSLAAPFGGVQSRVRHVEGFVECAGKRVETDSDARTVGINHIVPDDAPVLGFEEFPG